jgi:hypothetical protein
MCLMIFMADEWQLVQQIKVWRLKMLNYKLNKNIFICTIQTTIAHRELRHRPTTHSYDHHLNMPLLCGIHPHTRANINKVESIQRRAARFVTNNYDPRASVTTLLQDLNWPTLQHRRELAKLVMMYRITYHLISKYHTILLPISFHPDQVPEDTTSVTYNLQPEC